MDKHYWKVLFINPEEGILVQESPKGGKEWKNRRFRGRPRWEGMTSENFDASGEHDWITDRKSQSDLKCDFIIGFRDVKQRISNFWQIYVTSAFNIMRAIPTAWENQRIPWKPT